MGNNSQIDITSGEDVFLNIQGTQSNRVTIRGKEALSGYWKGIYITITNVKNLFEHLDISDGGASALGWATTKANITVEWDGALKLNNCTSARSNSECDVVISTFGSTPTIDVEDSDLEVCTE